MMVWWGWVALGVAMVLLGGALCIRGVRLESLRALSWHLGVGVALILVAGFVGTVPIGFPDSTHAPAAFRNSQACS